MSPRITSVLAALLFALTVFVTASAPAQAAQSGQCFNQPVTMGNDPTICMYLNYTRDPGGKGFFIQTVYVSCTPPQSFKSDMQIDGHSMVIENNKGAVVWTISEADSNVTNNCGRTWAVNAHPGSATSLSLRYYGTTRLNIYGGGDFSTSLIARY